MIGEMDMRKIIFIMITILLVACSPASGNGANPLATQVQDPNATGSANVQTLTTDTTMNPYAPQASDSNLIRQEAFVDSSTIQSLTTNPVQYEISFNGNLPTPCNQLRVLVNRPDTSGMIAIEVYSVVDPGKVCAQVLQPFSVVVNLGSLAKGVYPVQVNGTKQGEINAP